MSEDQAPSTGGAEPGRAAAEGGDSKRASARRKTILGGRVFDDEGRVEDCIISDLSVAGVRIRSSHPFPDATHLTLRIERFGEMMRGVVMWRRGDHIGLRFLRPFTAIPPAMASIFKLVKEKEKNGAA